MKKIKLLISTLILFFIGVNITYAASLNVTANKSTVVVGNTVTITVNASGAAGWEYCLNYDKSIFSLSSTNSDTGGTCVLTGSTLIGYSKVTFTLKAIKSGSSTITVDSAAMYNDSGNEIQFSKGSVSVSARTQAEIEASYSTNANLKDLSVADYSITPAFDKDTTSYTLEVPNEVETVTINASKEDGKASLIGDGTKELTEGLNKFEIVVTAEKGNKKTYTIEITRKELNPINVKVDGEDMTVVRKAEALKVPAYYTLTEVTIDGETIPALNSDITGFILVGLKNTNGDINLYIYNESSKSYTIYKQVVTEGFPFISLTTSDLIDGYKQKKQIEINGLKVDSYTSEEESDIVLVYGMNAKTGETAWYKYDTKEGTFQRYLKDKATENTNLYFIIAIIFAVVSGLTIILLIVVMVNNSKIRKKNNKLIEILENTRKKPDKELLSEEITNKNLNKQENGPKEEKILNENDKNKPLDKKQPNLEEYKETIENKQEIKEEVDKSQLSQRELRRLEKQQETDKKTQTDEKEKVTQDDKKNNTEENKIVSENIEKHKKEKSKNNKNIMNKVEKK